MATLLPLDVLEQVAAMLDAAAHLNKDAGRLANRVRGAIAETVVHDSVDVLPLEEAHEEALAGRR